jgi:hypothetical protein
MSRMTLRGLLRGPLSRIAIAAVLAMAVPSLALAQEHKDDHKGPPPKGGGGPPPPHPAFKPAPPPGGPAHPPLKPAFIPHPPGPPGGPPHPEFAHPGPGGPGGPPGGGGPRFTFHGRDFNRVHVHPFIYPQGWAYRQWAVGAVLPPIFMTPDYYYPDWAQLGLEPPPPGDQWVRYGPDLLLIDTTTGQVVDVAYGVFYDD